MLRIRRVRRRWWRCIWRIAAVGGGDLALVGGVTVNPQPTAFVVPSRHRGLAPDAGASLTPGGLMGGVGWSEGVDVGAAAAGCAAVGSSGVGGGGRSAVNQDGASNGLTAPTVLRSAGGAGGAPMPAEAAEVDVVEGMGPGPRWGSD